jgi:hypothetical protein
MGKQRLPEMDSVNDLHLINAKWAGQTRKYANGDQGNSANVLPA